MQPSDRSDRRIPSIYLAGPLFSDAERTFNEMVTEKLEEWVDVYLPQRDGGLVSQMIGQGVPVHLATQRVFEGDMDAILHAEYLVAVLDGRTIDEGVAFELGVAFSHAKRCIGLQTDSRRLASWGNNPMISGALETVLLSVDELIDWLVNDLSVRPEFVSKRAVESCLLSLDPYQG